jgi:HPt (histidine-containing phosphotransfer) domain-containing protein
MKGFELEILAAGCTGYVTKPIDIDVLLGALAEKLGGRRVQGAAPARISPVEEQPVAPAAAPAAAMPVATSGDTGPIVSRLANHPRLRAAARKFAARLDEQLAAMELELRAGKFPELAALAHWLKGAGGTVGYDAFTVPARTLESCAKAAEGAGARAALDELHGLAERMVVPEEDVAA